MPDLETLIHRRVAEARDGTNPSVIARVRSGWVVAGDRQVVFGYCLLLPDPVVPDLNALATDERARFLLDMAAIGDVLLEVTGARRINYEILGNSEPALHAHLFPRYDSEPEGLRRGPIWSYDWSTAPPFDRTSHAELITAVARGLATRGVVAPLSSQRHEDR
jgi:diadenosine tetraphosphate (Ap4A) HIT family hydrolase